MNSDAQGVVERMIGEGAPFEAIEQYIDALPLPSEQLGAPVARRRVVSDWLAGVGDPSRPLQSRRLAASSGAMNEQIIARAPSKPGARSLVCLPEGIAVAMRP